MQRFFFALFCFKSGLLLLMEQSYSSVSNGGGWSGGEGMGTGLDISSVRHI